MIKKYIAMGLIFVIGISPTVSAYANEGDKMSFRDIERFK